MQRNILNFFKSKQLTCDEGLIYHRLSFNNIAINWEFASWNYFDNITPLNQFNVYLIFTEKEYSTCNKTWLVMLPSQKALFRIIYSRISPIHTLLIDKGHFVMLYTCFIIYYLCTCQFRKFVQFQSAN